MKWVEVLIIFKWNLEQNYLNVEKMFAYRMIYIADTGIMLEFTKFCTLFFYQEEDVKKPARKRKKNNQVGSDSD